MLSREIPITECLNGKSFLSSAAAYGNGNAYQTISRMANDVRHISLANEMERIFLNFTPEERTYYFLSDGFLPLTDCGGFSHTCFVSNDGGYFF